MHTVKNIWVKFNSVEVNVKSVYFFTTPLFSPHLRTKHTQTLKCYIFKINITGIEWHKLPNCFYLWSVLRQLPPQQLSTEAIISLPSFLFLCSSFLGNTLSNLEMQQQRTAILYWTLRNSICCQYQPLFITVKKVTAVYHTDLIWELHVEIIM